MKFSLCRILTHIPQVRSHLRNVGDFVVAPVEKANVLAMLDEVTSLKDVHKLASDEDVQKWQSATPIAFAQRLVEKR
ncbi:hypothetical protein [Nostoc sp. UHCC 0251]|uniref:hypothetical protein n=1 Tax=Nostoc sp. UHCC 0251 TaxID=3110240 RepID=UPI002B21DA1A|nr:hypothetical protein [Nostoc sp. UHCC 0251]MEA5625176.1 hypothetical protein [Nostoc sp. UHCC 0251]